jgi:diguanylate cyclase (GGDEF)-like protein
MAVLAVGVAALAGLALSSTATTERATARVAAASAIGDTWGHLFDHVNLEEDMMHAYLGTQDEAQRHEFAQTIGGGAPFLGELAGMGDRDTKQRTEQTTESYHTYTATLNDILLAGRDPTILEKEKQEGEFAAAAVRQLVSAGLTEERQATRVYNSGVNAQSRRLRAAVTAAFSVCLGLLALCLVALLGYQRRVERQAAMSRYDSLHDTLTGLPNRALLAERVNVALSGGKRRGEPIGLLLIDLDGFKEVNDTLGHQFGDVVLREVAARLAATIGDAGTVARLGGDEFAVLLPRLASSDEGTAIADRLVTVLRQPVEVDELVMEVGASIGVAVYPTSCDDADQLLQCADIAMYTAKRAGLGVAEYDSSQNARHPKQLTLLAELRRALDDDEIVLHYQPKVDTATGQFRGVEALARWQHPQRGLMGPLEFIPLAEQSGLIEKLTYHVLDTALRQCRSWRQDGIDLPVAVNISARCLSHADFADQVAALLRAQQLPPNMLTLEITETAVISNSEQALNLLREIRALGVRLSVDDFGTGYSSMIYLQQLPITELKIDRCFVSRLRTEASDRTIVQALLDLARNLDLDVVAEGVEDQQTCDELTALGCDVCQGFFFSRPVPAADLTALLTWQMTAGSAQPPQADVRAVRPRPAGGDESVSRALNRISP